MREDSLEDAEEHYREAENIYRHIHAELGLANVLQAIGHILREPSVR